MLLIATYWFANRISLQMQGNFATERRNHWLLCGCRWWVNSYKLFTLWYQI